MYPYLNTFMGTWELYDVMTIVGAVLAVMIQMVMLYKGTKKKRCILFSGLYGLYSFLGGYVSSFVRQTSYGKQIKGNILENVAGGEGKHYLGIVLVCALLCIPCTKLLCRLLRIQKEQWKNTEKVVHNALAVGILVHHICVRLGCFFRGCCYGKYYDGIFSITISYRGITYPVFPSQLLEVLISLILIIILGVMIVQKKDVLGAAVIGYAINIIITENVMDQKGCGMIWGITIVQWWAIALLFYGVFCCILIKRGMKASYSETLEEVGKK